MVESVAMAVGRQDLALLEQIAPAVRQLQRHATGKGHVAFAVQQRLAGLMHRHQRGRTSGLDRQAGAFQVEDMADAGGQEILVIAGMAQQEHAGILHQIRVRADVEIEIAAHPAAGENANGTAEIFRHMPGIFQRLPRAFQKLAVLGVHDRGLFQREAEELGVEPLEPVEDRGGGHEIRLTHPGGAFAIGQQFLDRQVPDRFDAVAQIGPECRHIRRAGQMRRHAGDRNGVFGQGSLEVITRH